MIPENLRRMLSTMLEDFRFPDIQEKQKSQDEFYKKKLESFYKQSLGFNPLSCRTDIRFMETQVYDPVYNYFQIQTECPAHSLYILQGISGAGKTGTVKHW
jgi:hypothetical protein